MAQRDESPDSAVKDIINIFSQVLFCVPDVERASEFTCDYPLSSLPGASAAPRWVWGEGSAVSLISCPRLLGRWELATGRGAGKGLLRNKRRLFKGVSDLVSDPKQQLNVRHIHHSPTRSTYPFTERVRDWPARGAHLQAWVREPGLSHLCVTLAPSRRHPSVFLPFSDALGQASLPAVSRGCCED